MTDRRKRVLWIACGYLVCLFVVTAFFSGAVPKRLFEFRNRLKNPDYYAWREGTGEFPGRQFWSGFNTDRNRERLFLGKSREDIQARLPLLEPVSDEDLVILNHIRATGVPRERFSVIRGSSWLLEFDEKGACIDFRMPKA